MSFKVCVGGTYPCELGWGCCGLGWGSGGLQLVERMTAPKVYQVHLIVGLVWIIPGCCPHPVCVALKWRVLKLGFRRERGALDHVASSIRPGHDSSCGCGSSEGVHRYTMLKQSG